MAEGMSLIGGFERFEAENALNTLMTANAIMGDSKLMKAIEQVAEVKKRELDDFTSKSVLRHKDRDRDGKVDF